MKVPKSASAPPPVTGELPKAGALREDPPELPFPETAGISLERGENATGVGIVGIRRRSDAAGGERFDLEVQKLRVRAEHASSPAALLQALESPDYYLRNEAAHALIRWSGERGWVRALIDFLGSKEGQHPPHAFAWGVKALVRIAAGGDPLAKEKCAELRGRSSFIDQELGVALGQPLPPPGRMSFPFLPVANGSVTAVLDAEDGSIRHLRDSIFSNPREGESTRDLIPELPIPKLVNGSSHPDRMLECGYLEGTIGAFRRSVTGDVEWTTYVLPAFGGGSDDPARPKRIEVLVEARNRSDDTVRAGVGQEATIRPKDRVWFSATIDLSTKDPNPVFGPDPSSSARLESAKHAFEAWHTSAGAPDLPPDEERLYRQMRACLLMGQAEDGQIVASIPPGHWNISWVRDMSYALVAMAECGELPQAKRGLEFLFGRDHRPGYVSFPFLGIDSGVGAPYQISVVRHYGDGSEEADVEDGSPNIEFDGFGLALWALHRYVDESGDTDFARAHWQTITEKVGDAILAVVEGETGLIKRDSSIWERHLPGRRFTYTSAACERGLRSLVSLAERIGDGASAERYRGAAEGLRSAIREHLIGEDGAILGYAGEPLAERTYDASTIEVLN